MLGGTVTTSTVGSRLVDVVLAGVPWTIGAAVAAVATVAVLQRWRPTTAERVRALWSGTADCEPPRRRLLRVALGILWCVEGLLHLQPAVPGGFPSDTLAPALRAAPDWAASLVRPFLTAWTAHPVLADSVVLWAELGLGVLLLRGGTGPAARAVCVAALAWAGLIWLAGQGLGGIFVTGAGWLTGVPGSAAAYAVSAGLLLMPLRWWESRRAARTVLAVVGAWMLLGAWLQAFPAQQSAQAGVGPAAVFARGSATLQPTVLRAPIAAAESMARGAPGAVNGALVLALTLVGAGLLLRGTRPFAVAGAVLCGATWWLAQDFGFLGGTGTDPGTALALLVLLAVGRPAPAGGTSGAVRTAGRWTDIPAVLRRPLVAGVVAFGVAALAVVPAHATALSASADADAALVDSGGTQALHGFPATGFRFDDQDGRPISLQQLRGKLVVLTFLDPVCSDVCPVIAGQLAAIDRRLGPLAQRIEIVALDTNPVFQNRRDVATFTREHGLGAVTNWHFLSGNWDDVHRVLAGYRIEVTVPQVGMVSHDQGIYLLAPDGSVASYLADGAAPAATAGYADLVATAIRQVLA